VSVRLLRGGGNERGEYGPPWRGPLVTDKSFAGDSGEVVGKKLTRAEMGKLRCGGQVRSY